MKTWTYKGCSIRPETIPGGILIGMNGQKNQYRTIVWRIEFPDNTWVRVGTKAIARGYIDGYLR
jgi:hypothetical protein